MSERRVSRCRVRRRHITLNPHVWNTYQTDDDHDDDDDDAFNFGIALSFSLSVSLSLSLRLFLLSFLLPDRRVNQPTTVMDYVWGVTAIRRTVRR